MKRVCRVVLRILLVAIVMAGVSSSLADWTVGDSYKMHWPQLPDLTPLGMDVSNSSEPPMLLADDFRCTESGPITRIHVWGSWWRDGIDPAPTFTLSLHANVPAGTGGVPYSRPGELLWTGVFVPGAYTSRVYASQLAEGWLEPPAAYTPPPADTTCIQYNFSITNAPFVQTAGTTNWLDVQCFPSQPGLTFGWKTSSPELRWADDACWQVGVEPGNTNAWGALVYPPGHPLAGQSLDLAFVIDGGADLDFGDAPDTPYPTRLASDGARHLLVAGGPLLGALVDAEADGQPAAAADGDDLNGADDEDGVVNLTPFVRGSTTPIRFSLAGSPAAGVVNAWIDFNADGDWADAGEHVVVDAPIGAGGAATIGVPVPALAALGTTYLRARVDTGGGLGPSGLAPDGEVEDYGITIGDPPSHKMHYPQWPDPFGWDVKGVQPLILADDFRCSSNGLITQVQFWGSWLNDTVGVLTSVHLSLHSDDRSGPYSKPGELLWQWDTTRVTAEPWGASPQGWFDPAEPVVIPMNHTNTFLYTVDVPTNAAFVQKQDTIYWLDVQVTAVNGVWGWKTSASEHFEDDAVWAVYDPQNPKPPEWKELVGPDSGVSLDLAFLIDGEPVEEPQPLDFGDAPQPPYATRLAGNGARHTIGGPWLGPADDAPDAEADGQPQAQALGDDLDSSGDDEDGVWFPSPEIVHGVATNFTVIVNSLSGSGGVVEVWLDRNADGTWQPGEKILSGAMTNGTYLVPLVVPVGSASTQVVARCRISTAGVGSPLGAAPDGEVEDHPVTLVNGYLTWCNLQWPPAATTTAGEATQMIYGQVWHPGLTDLPGPGAGIIAQLGYGPDGTSPVGNPQWKWFGAAYNVDVGNNDEYMTTLSPPTPGTYDYAFRYSRNGSEWSYGDLDGSNNGYSPAQAGNLVVTRRPDCPKWDQPIDCLTGVDLRSYGVLEGEKRLYTVADDWLCDGRPITTIRWWGSYIGCDGPPEPPLPETRPVAFRLTWFADVPAGPEPGAFSHPGEVLTNVVAYLEPYGTVTGRPGRVIERFVCTSDLTWMEPEPPVPFEQEYEYTCELEEPWIEKEGTVYWLAIEALYPPADEPVCPWGWKTTHPDSGWNDDAVVGIASQPWQELTYPPAIPPWGAITNWPYAGASVDMAFQLRTDVCPRRGKKWSQPPDLWRGIDSPAHAPQSEELSTPWPVRANDFVSDGRRITDLHWWGSYLGWQSDTNAVVAPPRNASEALQGFLISWHTDIPTNAVKPFSEPASPPLWQQFVPVAKCHEVYYGVVTQSWVEPLQYEHEYQYYVDLLDPEVGKPWLETNGVVYWLSLQAVFPQGWQPHDPSGGTGGHRGWGWLSTPPSNFWNDISVVATNYTAAGPVWQPGVYMPTNHPWRAAGYELDLAFELTTDEVKAGPWGGPIVITNIQKVAGSSFDVASVGDIGAGVQILQVNTNLLTNVWVNVATNPLPLPPPYTNIWHRVATGVSNEYHRVLQKKP